MTTSVQALTVNFHGQDLFIVEHNGQPYTPMKTIVTNMGLDWSSQLAKLNANPQRWGMALITIPTLGDMQQAACMPLRKLFGWLSTISPSRVKSELREKIIFYQNECDDVLWEHWTKNQQKPYALRDLPKSEPKFLTPAMLRHIQKQVSRLSFNQVGSTHAGLGKLIKDTFNVHKRDMIPIEKYAEVCTLLGCEPDTKALQGDLLEPIPVLATKIPEGFELIETIKRIEFESGAYAPRPPIVLSASQKRVLMVMQNMATNEGGHHESSRREISNRVGINEDVLNKELASLIEKGLLLAVDNDTRTGKFIFPAYNFTVPIVEENASMVDVATVNLGRYNSLIECERQLNIVKGIFEA